MKQHTHLEPIYRVPEFCDPPTVAEYRDRRERREALEAVNNLDKKISGIQKEDREYNEI